MNAPETGSPAGRQPSTLPLVTCLQAPSMALSNLGGEFASGAEGAYVAERRIVSTMRVLVNGARRTATQHAQDTAGHAAFQYTFPGLGDPVPHATVGAIVERTAIRSGYRDTIHLSNDSGCRVEYELAVELASDLARLSDIRAGIATPVTAPIPISAGLEWTGDDLRVTASATPPPDRIDASSLRWSIHLPPGATRTLTITVSTPDTAPEDVTPIECPNVAGDAIWQRFLRRSVDDLNALVLQEQGHAFLAAGAPWYLTLFGRDSLLAATMCHPYAPELAASTLHALALHQGRRTDPTRAEEPGKILHEYRPDSTVHGRSGAFYGSADATALWLRLFTNLWADPSLRESVRDLLPAARAATTWLCTAVDRDGLVFYDAIPGLGDIHQGWKDSTDSVFDSADQDSPFPLALCEVQGYSYAALRDMSTLLDAIMPGDGLRPREAAARLHRDFHEHFWVRTADGTRYPALALDGKGDPADVLSSNMGHLIGTGLLSRAQERGVADLLMSPDLSAATGLRTVALSAPRYRPASYHNGSIWPHDVAVTMMGLMASGFIEEATTLARRLVAASAHFNGRLPELWGGETLPHTTTPLTYPTACSPQAWAAASALVCARVFEEG